MVQTIHSNIRTSGDRGFSCSSTKSSDIGTVWKNEEKSSNQVTADMG